MYMYFKCIFIFKQTWYNTHNNINHPDIQRIRLIHKWQNHNSCLYFIHTCMHADNILVLFKKQRKMHRVMPI